MNEKRTRFSFIFLAGFFIAAFFPGALYALPEGESVVSGSATFDRSESRALSITTPSDKLIVNYNSFSINTNEAVHFNQPSSSSVVLNRVIGVEPSQILGSMSANGKVFLVNPNGILFGPESRVDVAGLLASTLDIDDEDFLNGNYVFKKNGSSSYVINQGAITAQPGGYVILLSQGVSNELSILADLGTVLLASGEHMTLSLDDREQISVVVDKAVEEKVLDAQGEKMTDAVHNSGTITARGGKVLLTAKVLHSVFDHAINNEGVICATSLVSRNGVIELRAEGAALRNSGTLEAETIAITTHDAEVINTGTIKGAEVTITVSEDNFENKAEGVVSSDGNSQKADGGKILINAEKIFQYGVISADALSGGKAGEVILVAKKGILLAEGSATAAKALADIGSGGRVIINATAGNTLVYMNAVIDVSAGNNSGNAGFVEVSAFHQLGFYGAIHGRAPPGFNAATVVFDPASIVIQTGSTDSLFNPNALPQEAFLDDSGDSLAISPLALSLLSVSRVWLQATDTITVNSPITITPSLQLDAGNAIIINADITSLNDVEINAGRSIQVNDAKIKAKNITLTAHASITNEEEFAGGDPGEFLNDIGLLNLSGPVGTAYTNAAVEVLINASAILEAEEAITIKATAEANAVVNALGFVLGIAHSDSIATATALIKGGAQVDAGGALKLEANIINTSHANSLGASQTPSMSLAVAKITSNSTASIEDGATIDAGSVEVIALNTNTITASAGPLELFGASSGIAISDTQIVSNANASIYADMEIPGAIRISASSVTEENNSAATAEPKSAISGIVDSIKSAVTKYLSDKQPKAESKSSPIDISASLAISENSINANAFIASPARIRSESTITITAYTEDNFQIFSASEAEEAKAALSGAIAYGVYRSTARAYIDDNADVACRGTLEIKAETKVPNQIDWTSFIPSDVWEGIKNYGLDFEGLVTEGIFSGYVRSAAAPSDDGFGFAGCVAILKVETTAEAYIGSGARVNQEALYATALQNVKVHALNTIHVIDLVGVFSFAFNPLGNSGKVSIGGTYNQIDYITNTRAFIEDHALVSAQNDVTVQAESTEKILTIALAGGSAEKFGVEGAFSFAEINGNTLSFIEDEAVVEALDGDLNVHATRNINLINVTGGFVKAENVGVGISVSVNKVIGSVQAFIGNYVTDVTLPLVAGSITSGRDIDVSATANQKIGSFSLAGVLTSKSSSAGGETPTPEAGEAPTPETPETSDAKETPELPEREEETPAEKNKDTKDETEKAKTESKGSFGLGISGDVAFNTIDMDTLAYIDGTGSVDAGRDLKVTALNDSTVHAIAGSIAISVGSGTNIGIAGSFTKNVITATTKAFLASISVTNARDIILSAHTTGEIKSICAGAAGGGTAGVAGSVSFNVIGNVTEAYLDHVSITTCDTLNLSSTDDTDINVIAGALGFGKDTLGFGASVAINSISSKTKTYIESSIVTTVTDTILSASSLNTIWAIAGSLGVSKAAGIAATMAWNTIKNETDVFISNSKMDSAITVGGKLLMTALDNGNIKSISGAIGAGKSAAFGVGASYNEISSFIRAFIFNSTVDVTDALNILAKSTSTIETISAGGSLASSISIAGAVSVNTIANTLSALIYGASDVSSDSAIDIKALDQSTVKSISGAISGAGSASFGAAIAVNDIANILVSGVDSSILIARKESISITSETTSTISSVAASGQGAGSFALGGSVSLNEITNSVESYIKNNADVSATLKNVNLYAHDNSTINSLAGNVQGAGTATIGAAIAKNDIANVTSAYIYNADLEATEGSISVSALSEATIETLSAGIAGAGTVTISGAVSLNAINNSIYASISNSLLTLGKTVSALGAIHITATDNSEIKSLSGQIGGAGAAAIGGSAAYNEIENTIFSYIKNAVVTSIEESIFVQALSNAIISTISAGGSGGGAAGIAGAVAINDIANTTSSYIESSTVSADDSILVFAQSTNETDIYGGTIGGGGGLGFGGSGAVNLINNVTKAYILNSPRVEALGNGFVSVPKRDASLEMETCAGVIVYSYVTEDIGVFTGNAAGGGGAGIAATVSVSLINDTTEAYIQNSTINPINTAANPLQESIVSALNASTVDVKAGSVALGGAFGAGATSDTTIVTSVTKAYIENGSSVSARKRVLVSSCTKENIWSLTICGAGSSGIGVSGSVAVIESAIRNEAYVSASTLFSDGDISIYASDNLFVDLYPNSTAVGGVAGVGGSVAYLSVANSTTSWIIDSTTNAHGITRIDALSFQNIFTHAVNVNAGFIGAGGTVIVNAIDTVTAAFIKESAGKETLINTDALYENDEQDVTLQASNTLILTNTSGTVSVGGVGLGASIDVSTIKGTVTAAILGGTVNAGRTISVLALFSKRVDSSVKAFGGGGIGVQGAVSIITIGGLMTSEGLDASENTENAVQSEISGSAVGDSLGSSASALKAKSAIDEKREELSISDLFETSGETLNATSAYIGDATLSAGRVNEEGDIVIEATDVTHLTITSGAGSGGVVGVGGGVGILSIENRTYAYIMDGAEIGAAHQITIRAQSNIIDSTIDAYAGAVGAVGLGAAVIYADSKNNASAYMGNATITNVTDLNIHAFTTTELTANALGASFGALAGGIVYSRVSEEGVTKAYIKGESLIENVKNLSIFSSATTTLISKSIAAAGGLISGSGAASFTIARPHVFAYVDEDAELHIDENIAIEAQAITSATSTSIGVTVAALGAGLSYADALSQPFLDAFVAGDAFVTAGKDIRITTRNTSYATASANASAGALIGFAASSVVATVTPSLHSYIGNSARIEAEGILTVEALNTDSYANAQASGICVGLAAFGSNDAFSYSNATTEAYIGSNVSIEALDILIDAYASNRLYAYSLAGAGGLVAGTVCEAGTFHTNETSAYIMASDSDNVQMIVSDFDITLKAEAVSTFNAQANSVSAGLVGLSGAELMNSVNSTVSVIVGKNNALHALRDVSLLAINRTDKPNIGVNLLAGAGGVFGGAAGSSISYINNNTFASIDGNDLGASLQAIEAGENIVVLAENSVTAYDKGRLAAGGAISMADVHSRIFNNNYATSSVGSNARLTALGDVSVLSHATAIIGTSSETLTWGLASLGDGTAEVSAMIDNDVLINSNAHITAQGEINIGAGVGLDDIQNYLYITADSRSWVSGGIPISRVHGYAVLKDYSDVTISSGAEVRAGTDVNIHALRGFTVAYGYARAKKKTYLFFGIPITIYSNGSCISSITGEQKVTIDGTIESGLNRYRSAFIDEDGNVSGNIEYTRLFINLLERLDAKIRVLQETIDEYDPTGAFDGKSTYPNGDILLALYTEKDYLVSERDKYIDLPDVALISFHDTATTGGDINISGALLGSGYLSAPGNDFRIQIINDSFAHMEIGNLEIPEFSSGKIIVNGKTITTHPTVHVSPGANLGSRIEIINLVDINDPIRVPDPSIVVPSDIVLNGDIINYSGNILVLNNSGSIATSGNISAKEIVIVAPNGSFVHEYIPGLYHAGTVIAGDNIYISAEILDINGTIQSGLPYRYITIPEFDPLTDLYSEYEGGPLKFIPIEGDEYAKAVWDADNNRIILYRVAFKGGSVELFGEIVSTTTAGKIAVMDGYGEIVIKNKSSRDLVVSSLDIGERIAGKIKITDTGIRINDFARITIITAEENDLRVVTGYRERLSDGTWIWHEETSDPLSDTRLTEYLPYPGAKVADFGTWTLTYKDVEASWDEWWNAILTTRNPFLSFYLAINASIKESLLNMYGVKADNAIAIEFLGNTEKGILEIVNEGSAASDLYINGRLLNKYGDVKITNTLGSIFALSDTHEILGRDIYLSAEEGSIGSREQEININTQDGRLFASAEGYIHIEEVEGELVIASVTSRDDVRIAASGSLWNEDMDEARVVARGITLISHNAGIGTLGSRFLIDARGGIVNAEALNGIYLTEISGDMYVGKIESIAGDVYLVVPGSIEDHNFEDRLDDDTLELLNEMAQDLQLQDEARIQASIAEYKEEKKDEYLESHRLDDNGTPFDPTDDTYDIPRDEALAWEYELTAEEEESFYEGLWSDDDMVNAKNVDTLPQEGATNQVEDPNIAGRDIVIRAGGAIGSLLDSVVIWQKDIDEGNLTLDERIRLAMAEPDDITYDGETLTVALKSDIDIAASGSIDIEAKDHIYLGSEIDVNIECITSTENDIRLKIVGTIRNAHATSTDANIISAHLILEALRGAIGETQNALVTDLRPGSIVNAKADGSIYITERAGDIAVGVLESVLGGVSLTAANGTILPASGISGANIIAAGPSLIAAPQGTIGISALGVIAPLRFEVKNGPVLLDIGKRVNLISGYTSGTIDSPDFYLPLLSPALYPSPLYPRGRVYFNGAKIWPPSSNNPFYLIYLAQATDSISLRYGAPGSGEMSLYQIRPLDVISGANNAGAVYLYHPLTVADASFFDSLDLSMDAYSFIDGRLELSEKRGFFPYFEEDDPKKKFKK
jgi:filamentous hemagglutinin family protein